MASTRVEPAGQDEVDDVVERLASQVNAERDTVERRLATLVPDLRLPHWNACAAKQDTSLGNRRRQTWLQVHAQPTMSGLGVFVVDIKIWLELNLFFVCEGKGVGLSLIHISEPTRPY